MPAKKRRSAAQMANLEKAKRARRNVHANAKVIVSEVISLEDDFELSCSMKDKRSVRKYIVDLAKYAHSLQEEVKELKHALVTAENKAAESPEEIAEEAKRIWDAIVCEIKQYVANVGKCILLTFVPWGLQPLHSCPVPQ